MNKQLSLIYSKSNTPIHTRTARKSRAETEDVELLKTKNMKLVDELEASKKRVEDLEKRNKYMSDRIRDLYRLVKRVGKEGYLQLKEVEKEKEELENKYNSLQKVYECLDSNSTHMDKCILYWKMIDEGN